MRLCSKINYGRDIMLREHFPNCVAITDVSTNKMIIRMVGDRHQVLQISGISELVEIDHGPDVQPKPVQHEIRADKPGATSYQNCQTKLPGILVMISP